MWNFHQNLAALPRLAALGVLLWFLQGQRGWVIFKNPERRRQQKRLGFYLVFLITLRTGWVQIFGSHVPSVSSI